MATQLTPQEQSNVRAALRVLNVRHGGLAVVAHLAGASERTLRKVMYGTDPGGALTAIRVAQAAGVSVDDVLTGRFPGRTACRRCGHPIDDAAPEVEGGDVH